MPDYPIRLPEKFVQSLSNSRCMRLIQEVLEEFSEFIARNEMVFFRSYTDHGPRHVESVLETACALMSETSSDLVTPEDFCVLVTATVLHDSALHLQEPGFLALLSAEDAPILLPELDNATWRTLWFGYVSEVSRMSQSQLDDTFGVSEPIASPDLDNPNSWTPLQYAYIGEFIRRHHHRLAHEIACNGLPGVDGETKFRPRDAADRLQPFVDLSGLVARSHGTAIRPLLPYLTRHYHLRSFDSSHPVYLMVLLRIADYLQLQSARAPGNVFKIKRIQSPHSRREWKVHESIKDILYDQNADPESVEIIVDPKRTSIDVFLRVQDWLRGIQTELDTSWAVLGEVFGRFRERDLGLTIRRIRSNIDDTETFGKDAGFVPQRVSFTAADAELLKLLIKPLYGDRPEIAVRELVQNAVDAVLERHALGESSDQGGNADVEIHVKKHDDGKWSLVVEDYGIGMKYDTLANFFLNAGASFRSSMVWKKQFQTDGGDSIVLRSGRFGVGALAAFLLADDPKMVVLRVSTRHIHANSNEGLEFEAELTDRPLTVRHVTRNIAGTRIEVVTSSAPAFMQRSSSDDNNLVNEWDWFCLDTPRVRRVASSGRELAQEIRLPADVDTSPEDYHWIVPEGYQSVGWTFGKAPALVCNGIIVTRDGKTAPSLEESVSRSGKTVVSMPSLSVFDRNGKLPLTLDRLRVDFERLSFLDELRDDVLRNIAAYLAVCAPTDLRESRAFDITQQNDLRSHPAVASSIERIPWVLTPHGVALCDFELLAGLGVDSVVEVKDTKDIGLVMSISKHDQFAIAVTAKSSWDVAKKKDNLRIIKAAKRGVYRQRTVLDSADVRRLERAVELVENPHRAYRDDRSREGMPWYERWSDYMSGLFGKTTDQISPVEFHDKFQKLVESISDYCRETHQNEGVEMLRRLASTINRQLRESRSVTSEMRETFRCLVEVDVREDDRMVEHRIRRAIDAFEGRWEARESKSTREFYRKFERQRGRKRRTMSPHEARYILELALHKLRESLSGREVEMMKLVVYRLHDAVRNERDIPDAFLDAIHIIESLSPLNNGKFEIDGDVSKSVLEWDSISRSDRLRDDWAIAEYEIDQTVQIANVSSALGRVWREQIRDIVIPFDLESRKKQLHHLWSRKDMKRHLQHWESVLAAAQSAKK